MSAECHTCGSDIVYPEGTWPIGECPVCSERDRCKALATDLEIATEALQKITRFPFGLGAYADTDMRGIARDALARLSAAGEETSGR